MTTNLEQESILQRYQQVQDQIVESCRQACRKPDEIKLIVISKFKPVSGIRSLLDAGQVEFGESRVEEIEEKWLPLLTQYPDIKLHFIGKLQSRKIRQIVSYCQMIHSLDRIELAQKIANESFNQNKIVKCLIQINTGAEVQKAGISPNDFPDFLQACKSINHLLIEGIMCIPPMGQDPLPHFRLMQKIKLEFALKELSMGMSDDYLDAIASGATMLRIGKNILGARI